VNGILVNSEGMPIIGEGGPINIQGNQIEVNKEGMVIVDGRTVNKLAIKNIDINNSLSIGNNLFIPKNSGDVTESNSQILQGSLELSNVKIVKEMVNMITTQKNYDFNAKVIKTQDTTLNKTVNYIAR
ncbi:MAG: flagellar basal body rod C-terminal domain-containing protein, partial [Candidatus Cloacimonadota bacterium]|nr:flagellar basal body rod C-terminal domain-containing protein [Candidatus Cloacimonadota bacterium]